MGMITSPAELTKFAEELYVLSDYISYYALTFTLVSSHKTPDEQNAMLGELDQYAKRHAQA